MKRILNFFIIFIISVIIVGSLTACGAKTTAYSGNKWLRLDYGAEMEARDDAELNREHIEIPDGVDTIEIDGVEYNVIRESMREFRSGTNNILANDVDINQVYFIGEGEYPYEGIFNGNNYKLKGSFAGCVFYSIENAVIENVIISSDLNVIHKRVGDIFITNARNSVIRNCVNYFSPGPYSKDSGFIEVIRDSKIINCINYGDGSTPGAICNYAKSVDTFSEIIGCVNYGNVNYIPDSSYVAYDEYPIGGIVGRIYGEVVISDCINYGDLIGKGPIGGIVGGIYMYEIPSNWGGPDANPNTIIKATYYKERQSVENCVNYGNIYLRLDKAGDKKVTIPDNYYEPDIWNIYGIGGIAGSISKVKNCKNEGKFYGFENLEYGLKVDYSGGIAGVARQVTDCETKYTIPVQKGRALHVGKLVGYTIK